MRDKVSNNPAYVAALAGVAALVLLIGYWLKPAVPSSESVVSEQEKSQLENLLRREALNATAESLASVANSLFANVVRVEEVALGGVALAQDNKVLLLTPPVASTSVHVLSAAGKRSTAGAWNTTNGTTSASDLPFSGFQVPPGAEVPVSKLANPQQMRAGQWLIAVWRNPDGRAGFVSGFYGGVRVADCGRHVVREVLTSMPFHAGPSSGVFDLAGNLVAFVAPCGSRHLALSVDSVHTVLADASSLESRIEKRFGIQLSPISAVAGEHFRVKDGLMISLVTFGTPGDRAGLVPGDVLVSLSGEPVRILDDLEKYLTGGDPKEIDLRLVRQGKVTMARLSTAAGPPTSGVVFSPAEAGIPVETVLPASAAEKAGIQAGDRLLSINGTAFRTQEAVTSTLSRASTPAYVVLQRGNQKRGAFLNTK